MIIAFICALSIPFVILVLLTRGPRIQTPEHRKMSNESLFWLCVALFLIVAILIANPYSKPVNGGGSSMSFLEIFTGLRQVTP